MGSRNMIADGETELLPIARGYLIARLSRLRYVQGTPDPIVRKRRLRVKRYPLLGLVLISLLCMLPSLASETLPPASFYKAGELLVRFDERLTEQEVRARLGSERVQAVRFFKLRSRPESPTNRLCLV
jgi:hypothetical protein